MFSVSNFCKTSSILLRFERYRHKTHWAKLKRKTSPKHKAMNHFDEFYSSVFGKQWVPMKEALQRRSKYVAVVNNYGDTEETIELLHSRGAHCLKQLMSVQQEFHTQYKPAESNTKENSNTRMEDFTSRLQTDEISSIYPQGDQIPERLQTKDMTLQRDSDVLVEAEQKTEVRAQTLEQSLAQAEIDTSRIIDPSMGVTAESLYQYIPATQLKGMDEWIPESLYYSYYNKSKDFPLTIEPETEFTFPENLKVYTYEKDSDYSDFPQPKRCSTGVFNYYPLDCGSVLSVLALCLSPSDRVLDLCGAPGGKALLALQTLLPSRLVANDSSMSRTNRIKRIFKDYLIDFDTNNKWSEQVTISTKDGRIYTDDLGFDKILVDAPCTTDRHSITEDDNNLFRADRVKERLRIPELQAALLINALRLVKVGGAVVYSTCTLSPIQNDGVVHMALKAAFETHGIIAHVRDLTAPLSCLSTTLNLGAGASKPKYGQLVVPSVGANFGPTYFTRLVRVK
ncbi:5-methylcytosine rRNA methyltransferase nsun-4 [Plutella xylostella]|uniref:5-methylcytosine rRNA methyltransferase nsun-4 n=1 Tax=Plutella xylostella TaxID=51655 RepID=UPI00203278EF|nr:5-methylcytosine rRNA methyltransferase nsun-4 [Plutella xylostella]